MNNLKLTNTKHFLMTLMILAGTLCSCHKEEVEQEKRGKATITHLSQTKEGDDEEEGILQGTVSFSGGGPVANVAIDLYISGTTEVLMSDTTDSNGEFEMTVPYGTYFIEIIEANSNSTKTNEFTIIGNANLSIVI